MTAYRRYSRVLVPAVMLPLIVALFVSLFFQPYWGPLTRLGGLLENDYGWNEPEQEFKEPLFKIAHNIKEYDHYYDVVVVGDSFSHDPRKGWQNYFVKSTGLSLITLSQVPGTATVVTSEMFRRHPPRYLIFESLEQFSLVRLAQLKTLSPMERVVDATAHQTTHEDDRQLESIQPRFVSRDASPPLGEDTLPTIETRIDQSLNYLTKATVRLFTSEPDSEKLRSLWGSNKEGKTFILPLRHDTASFFSSKLNNSLLVYSLDISKATDAAVIKSAADGAWQMKRSIEANGKTKVIMMLFPDKLSIYAPYLVDPSVAPPSIIPGLANLYPDQIRLDEVFAKAAADKVQDLYLPDDTHCGYKGYKLAAAQLVNAINEQTGQKLTVVSK
jgi:hypothetical protein